MSDESNKPQAQLDKSFSLTRREQNQEWGAAPPPDDKKQVDPNTPKCAACGRHHAVVGITHESAEKRCIVETIHRLRTEIASLKESHAKEIASLKEEMEGVRSLLRLERAGKENAVRHDPSPTAENPKQGAAPTQATPSSSTDAAESVAPTESRADYLARRSGGA